MGIVVCPECGGKVSSSRKDCIHCGYEFPAMKKCPECDEMLEEKAKICPVCGFAFDDAETLQTTKVAQTIACGKEDNLESKKEVEPETKSKPKMKIKPVTWVAVALVTVGFILLGFAVDFLLDTYYVIGLGATGFTLILWIVFIIFTAREKKEKTCKKCKAIYDYDDIEYEEISREVKPFNVDYDKPLAKQRSEGLFYKFRFHCTCHECGETKTFERSVDGGSAYADGRIELKDPEDAIEQWYRSGDLEINSKKIVILGFVLSILSIVASILMFVLSAIMGTAPGAGSYDDLQYTDLTAYCGTYYGMDEDYSYYTMIVGYSGVEVYKQPLIGSGSVRSWNVNHDIEIYSPGELSRKNKEPSFSSTCYGALVFNTGSLYYWYYITDCDDYGYYEFTVEMTDGTILKLSNKYAKTQEKALAGITNDPKNYFGTYEHSGSDSYIELESDYDCTLVLNGTRVNATSYFYANDEIMKYFDKARYDSGIIVKMDAGDTYYWFSFTEDGDLLFNGQYTFSYEN